MRDSKNRLLAVSMSVLLLATVALAAVDPPVEPSALETADLERGRGLTRQFHDGELAPLLASFSEKMQATFDLAKLEDQRRTMLERLGGEVELLDEDVRHEGGYTIYARQSRYAKLTEPFLLQWAWNDEQRIVGFILRPVSPKRTP
jgi:hypothetical protein